MTFPLVILNSKNGALLHAFVKSNEKESWFLYDVPKKRNKTPQMGKLGGFITEVEP